MFKSIVTEFIYKDDEFEYTYNSEGITITKYHKKLENIKAENLVGIFAIATLEDNSTLIEVIDSLPDDILTSKNVQIKAIMGINSHLLSRVNYQNL